MFCKTVLYCLEQAATNDAAASVVKQDAPLGVWFQQGTNVAVFAGAIDIAGGIVVIEILHVGHFIM